MKTVFFNFPLFNAFFKSSLELKKSPKVLLTYLLKRSEKSSLVVRKKGKKKCKYQIISKNGVIISETTFKIEQLHTHLTKTSLLPPNKSLEKNEDSFYL